MNPLSRILVFFILKTWVLHASCNDLMSFFNFTVPLLPPLQNEFPTKCLEDLGCFGTGPPFYHPIFRPVFLLPFDEHNIPTTFLLYTRRNPNNPELLDSTYDVIRRSSFNPYCPTKIIIHGFSINPKRSEEYSIMKDAILQKGWHNVILVDWSESNGAPYFQAVANGRVVGAQLARLINALQNFRGASPSRFHIIGHSLGAAVAGWAGERLHNLGRITGLDPAGMYFYNSPPEMRLDISDADFVDVIITNGATKFEDGLATLEPLGHVNFYPNGGSVQPGCYNSSEELNDFDFNRNLCSHMRSLALFITTISSERCRFTGIACEDYNSFLSGRCSERFWWRSLFDHSPYSKAAEMGFHSRKPHNFHYSPTGLKYYLETSATVPFCTERRHYDTLPRSFVKY